MGLTKTWKQKTKSVGLFAAIGLASVGLGVAGNAAPAAAAAADNTIVCYSDTSNNGQKVLLMENELYRQERCNALRSWEVLSATSTWTSFPYSYVGTCASGGDQDKVGRLVAAVCEDYPVVTLSDYNTAGTHNFTDCIFKSGDERFVVEDCAGMSTEGFDVGFGLRT